MLTHDQTTDQDKVKTELTDTEPTVAPVEASTETEEQTAEAAQEEMNADETPAPVAETELETTPEAQLETEAAHLPEPEEAPAAALEAALEAPATAPEAEQEEAQPVAEPDAAPAPEAANEPEAIAVVAIESTPAPKPVAEKKPRAKAAKPKSAEEKAQDDMLSLYEESFSNLKKGQIVEGVVVGVNEREVMVDIGFKSEGVISISEFTYSGIPAKNEKINVFISETEDGEGKIHLSKKRADFILNIQALKRTFDDQTTVMGTIRRRVKGGMIVDVLGIEGFLPGSQMSLKPIPNLDQFIGKEMTFKIVSLDEDRRNLIISRKKVLEEEMGHKKQELLSHMEIGTELEGEVKNITQYGAFIDLGGVDGLLHLSDMSWGKINHPAEMLNIGDKLKVKVIHYDSESGKISLGLKQLVPHPWEHIEIKYPEGTRITGKVVSVKSYGAFVEIEPGVEGLVHVSEMSWTRKITDARRMVRIGETVNAIVLELDKEHRRISLGMKQMDINPWLTLEDRYPIGTVLNRKVKSLTTFGAFVEIEDGIDGLIHISDISWTKRIYHPREVFRRNQEVEAIVLQIDRALHRIALGVKQLKSDPWETLPATLPVNTEVRGKISKLIPKGVLVDIGMGEDVVEGFVPISHLAIPKLENSEDAFHISEELPLKVIELDTENRRLILSVKAFFFSRDARLQEEYIALHEQFMRDKIARQIKKRTEKETHPKEQATEDKVVEAVTVQAVQEMAAPEPQAMSEEPAPAEQPVAIPEPEMTEEPAAEAAPVVEEAAEEIAPEAEAAAEVSEPVTEEPVAEVAEEVAEPGQEAAPEAPVETEEAVLPEPEDVKETVPETEVTEEAETEPNKE